MSNPGNLKVDGLIRGTSGSILSMQVSAGAIDRIVISPANIFFPVQASSPPTYQKGGIYYNLTSGRIAVGDLTEWHMINAT